MTSPVRRAVACLFIACPIFDNCEVIFLKDFARFLSRPSVFFKFIRRPEERFDCLSLTRFLSYVTALRFLSYLESGKLE